ncbi:putative RNA editing 3' terminal uridylyl transferase 1 [Trypanosoma cruzi]|uniref:Putative RNA editing 3' terminal uridylyl transferase 1 n=1 Tax=Trypanosoma cruzi TaxID=5693 RepID=A0A2V2UFT6_TRYCR|nr:putative RNA editing 3' terminal uridylyl transferase 1 [Trypanosoma cruzi]
MSSPESAWHHHEEDAWVACGGCRTPNVFLTVCRSWWWRQQQHWRCGWCGRRCHTKRHPTRYELCIEDPYEENLNLGRHIGITKSLRVRTELYRGLLSLLKDGEKESCVFASTDLAESADATGPLSSKLPVRALFRLMALATQAIAESKRFSSMDNASGDIAGDGEVMTSKARALLLDWPQRHNQRRLPRRVWLVESLRSSWRTYFLKRRL